MKPETGRHVVAGASGYLGRHLVRALRRHGGEVTTFDLDTWPVQHREAVPGAVREADTVWMMAGRLGTEASFDHYPDFLDVNERGLLHLLDALRDAPAPPRVIFPSTRLVYGGPAGEAPAFQEHQTAPPKTVYAVNKLAAEGYLHAYQARYGIPYTVFRICVPYGDTEATGGGFGTLRNFLEPARHGRPVACYGDGRQRRSLIHVEDLVAWMVRASGLPATANRVFNAGGPDRLSIAEIARSVADHFQVPLETRPWPEDAARIESGDTVFDDAALLAACPHAFSHRFHPWLAGLEPARPSTDDA